MVHEDQIAGALAYIEAHLKEPFSLRDAAQDSGYSPFHFHRIFLAVTGETPAAFIRRRRLAESARELAEPGKRTGEIPQLWTEFNNRIDRIPHRRPGAFYGFCFTDDRVNPNFWYMAGAAVEQLSEIPAEMVAKTVPALTCAVFTHRGPVMKLGETYACAYQTWLPASGYELAAPFDFERYDSRFDPNSDTSELDIYIPVRRKE